MIEADLEEVERLVNELQQCDGTARPGVAAQIKRYGSVVVAPLLPSLSHSNWGVRYWAARILAAVGAEQARDALAAQAAVEQDSFALAAMGEALASISRSLTANGHKPAHVVPLHSAAHDSAPIPAPQYPPYSRQQLGWHRFERSDSGDWILVLRPYYAWLFSNKYPDIMSSSHTGWRETRAGNNQFAFFEYLSEEDVERIQQFIGRYSQIVIVGLNDHISPHFTNELDACVCLDFNMAQLSSGDFARTAVGELEYLAKYQQASDAVETLAEDLGNVINWVPISFMLDAAIPRCLTYVPPEPSKSFHPPRELAHRISRCSSAAEGIQPFGKLVDATLTCAKASLKNATLEEKILEWQRITAAGAIQLSAPVKGNAVYLVDDLYQSGATVWTYAKYLKSIGARWVFGLVCVKSLRDTDNV